MRLLVGLGNPGAQYAKHRHNIGFMAVDAIADSHGFGPFKARFQGHTSEGALEGPDGREKCLILKPQTYMNDSGRSVGEAARFYRIALEDVVVFYDELDLAPGKIKVKRGGGAAGHNGIRSIDPVLGKDYLRVRMGIGHPGSRERVTGHVLGDFSRADQDWLPGLLDACAHAAPLLLARDDGARFMTDVARLTAPACPEKPPKAAPGSTPKSALTGKGFGEDTADGPMADALKALRDRGQDDEPGT